MIEGDSVCRIIFGAGFDFIFFVEGGVLRTGDFEAADFDFAAHKKSAEDAWSLVLGNVRVTGTIFNISHSSADSFAVVLLEGAVEATPLADGTVRRLVPGDELLVSAGRTVTRRLSADEMADAVAWREGKIVFHDTPLGQAMERFSRHHDRQVTIAPDAQDLALGGRFGLDDFDAFLKDLEVALPVVVHREPNGNVRVERVQAEGK